QLTLDADRRRHRARLPQPLDHRLERLLADHCTAFGVDLAFDPRRVVAERLGTERQIPDEAAVARLQHGEPGGVERVAHAETSRRRRRTLVPAAMIEAHAGVDLHAIAYVKDIAREQRHGMVAHAEVGWRGKRDRAHGPAETVLDRDWRVGRSPREPARRDTTADRDVVRSRSEERRALPGDDRRDARRAPRERGKPVAAPP